MTETNNQSARGLDDRGQAEPPGLSVGSCSRSSLGKLSRFVAWMIEVPWLNHVPRHYIIQKLDNVMRVYLQRKFASVFSKNTL